MIEPLFDCSYADFPKSEAVTPGMKVLRADREARFAQMAGNVVYATKDGMELHLQIFMPRYNDDESKKYPLIVYVPGSAWFEQDVFFHGPQACELVKRGFVVAIVQYRPSTVAMFPAQIQDTKTAIRYLKKHADKYHIDETRIALWGDSSGAHTAVMAGITADTGLLDNEEEMSVSTAVSCIVDFYGPTNISLMNEVPSTMHHYTADSPEGMLIGKRRVDEHPDLAKKTVPMNYISKEKEIPPILMMHGNKDRLVPFEQSILLYEKLRAEEKEVEFYCIDEGDHGSAEFWCPTVFDIMTDFITTHWG